MGRHLSLAIIAATVAVGCAPAAIADIAPSPPVSFDNPLSIVVPMLALGGAVAFTAGFFNAKGSPKWSKFRIPLLLGAGFMLLLVALPFIMYQQEVAAQARYHESRHQQYLLDQYEREQHAKVQAVVAVKDIKEGATVVLADVKQVELLKIKCPDSAISSESFIVGSKATRAIAAGTIIVHTDYTQY